jgi:hypothetical protein
MTLKAPLFVVQDSEPRRVPVPSTCKKVLYLLSQQERWEGSASELAASIGWNARTPAGLSRVLSTPKVTAALAQEGVYIKQMDG